MTTMSTTLSPDELRTEAVTLRNRYNELSAKVNRLENAAEADFQPKLDRLDTMISALERDVLELDRPEGTNLETANKLHAEVQSELDDLILEIDTLSQGNPTTVSAALDATMRAVDKVGSKFKSEQ